MGRGRRRRACSSFGLMNLDMRIAEKGASPPAGPNQTEGRHPEDDRWRGSVRRSPTIRPADVSSRDGRPVRRRCRRTWRTISRRWVRKPMCPAPSSDLEPAPGIDWASASAGRRDDHVASMPARTSVGTSIFQRRSEMSKLSSWARPLGHHALVGLPDPLDHEVGQGPRLGLHSVQQVEELVHEAVVARQREPSRAPGGRSSSRSSVGTGSPHPERSGHPGTTDARPPAAGRSRRRRRRRRPPGAPGQAARSRKQGRRAWPPMSQIP